MPIGTCNPVAGFCEADGKDPFGVKGLSNRSAKGSFLGGDRSAGNCPEISGAVCGANCSVPCWGLLGLNLIKTASPPTPSTKIPRLNAALDLKILGMTLAPSC